MIAMSPAFVTVTVGVAPPSVSTSVPVAPEIVYPETPNVSAFAVTPVPVVITTAPPPVPPKIAPSVTLFGHAISVTPLYQFAVVISQIPAPPVTPASSAGSQVKFAASVRPRPKAASVESARARESDAMKVRLTRVCFGADVFMGVTGSLFWDGLLWVGFLDLDDFHPGNESSLTSRNVNRRFRLFVAQNVTALDSDKPAFWEESL